MTTSVAYVKGAELPSVELTWKDSDGEIIDLSSGWTFSLRIGTDPVTEKTAGITGAATAPNVTIAWSAAELDSIGSGVYPCQLWARRTSDSKDRVFTFSLHIKAAIVPPA